MSKIARYLVLLLAFLKIGTEARATHAAGAELVYTWVSGNTYHFTFKFYRDCETGNAPEPTTLYLGGYNTCNGDIVGCPPDQPMSKPAFYEGTQIPNGSLVGVGCPGYSTWCTDPSSTLPGYQEWHYYKDITLPSQCNNWILYTSVNARNGAIENLGNNPGGQTLRVEAKINNVDGQVNSSPQFTIKPIPYTCANIPFTYNNGAIDPDGDSLSFELANPLTNPGGDNQSGCPGSASSGIPYADFFGSIPYNNSDNPFNTNNTFSFNPFTGQMSFTAAAVTVAVLSVKVHEYRNGHHIGFVIRDLQLIIRACNVPPPQVIVDPASVYVGTYVNGQIEGCAGQQMHFCFDAVTEEDRILVVDDNHEFIDNNITVTYANQATDTVTGCVDWMPTFADTGLHIFVVTVKDSTCEPPGIPITNTFTIPIHIWPATEVIIQGPTEICPGEAVPLLAIGGDDYEWTVLSGDPGSMSCVNCDAMVATPSITTTYMVESQINTYCDKNRDTITITVRQPPVFDLGPDFTTCVNNVNLLNTNLDQTTFPNTVYTVQWDPPTYLDDPTSNTPTMLPTGPDVTYIVTITPDGFALCARKDTLNVTIIQGFDVMNNDTAICMGDTVQVYGTGDNRLAVSWSPVTGVSDPSVMFPWITPDTTHTYIATASYPGCRDSIQLFTIDAQPVAVVDAGPPEMTVCRGSKVQLNGTYTYPTYPYYTFLWTPGTQLTASDVPDPVFVAFDTAMLHFVVTTPIGCKGEDSILMNVIPSDFLEVSENQSMCPRDTVQLHVQSDGSTSLVGVNWTEDFHYVSDPTSTDPFVSPIASTTLTVVGTDNNGCKDTISTFVEVKPAAVVNLPDSVVIYPGEGYQMDPGGNALYFRWFPPAGLSSDEIANPLATPDVNTRYYVDAASESGCVTRDSIDVLIAPDSWLDVPNAFTPGIAPNATFKAVYRGNATLKSFVIYNRWGQKMFEGKDINQGWDGTWNGKPQPMGVYVYTIEAVSSHGKKLTKQGNVTLLR